MGLLAVFANGDSNANSDSNANGASSANSASGANGDFENTFQPQALNQYNFDAFKRGDFSSFARITPEECERSKKTASEMKQQRKLHTSKMAADSDSLDAAAAIFKSEQHHLRRRGDTLLNARGEWVKTQSHFNEKMQPGWHEQNQSLSLSQTKGQNAIGEINNRFSERRQALAELRSQ
ncbi:MAG: hypothetical protein SXA11_06600 [Cyanobacteriota bacterium]|nr:hypothetical protein [Cyanobacteriota bacterium]